MTETPVAAQTSPAPDDLPERLREAADNLERDTTHGEPNESVYRARIAELRADAAYVAGLEATVRDLRAEIDEALMLTEGCSSLKQLSSAFVELTARTAAAEAERDALFEILKQIRETTAWDDIDSYEQWIRETARLALAQLKDSPEAQP